MPQEEDDKTEELDESALIEEVPAETDARRRSHKNAFYRFFFLLVTHWAFNALI